MRTTATQTLTVLMTAVLLSGAFTACKSKKKIAAEKQPSGETEINVLCSGPEYFTDNKVFRANALGESMDQATAKKKALANARAQMASDINTQLKGVIDNYVNSREVNNVEEVVERFEGLTREVVDQKLTGVRTICEKQVTVNATGNFKTYIAIELSAQDLLAAYNERLSKDDRLKVDYDYEKFKETFDKEMEKLGK
ncbi:MAG: hypothetical protein KBA60_06325 [Flavobacteriales bacterium]|nr:hypothetical protein [Flavobacteriales bacterium]MBP7155604.1 hypothetical protein [Flavobacteriales bacterium]HQV74868.1 hypothetical protein [Flavobacteriales bacterium]HQW40809.1 hypothetical protein [Flavobacteriales bacterium]